MRKVNQQLIEAIRSGKSRTIGGNTQVAFFRDSFHVYLYGNLIANVGDDGDLHLCNCGWHTRTTQDRLNAILHAFRLPYHIRTRKGGHELCGLNGEVFEKPFSACGFEL